MQDAGLRPYGDVHVRMARAQNNTPARGYSSDSSPSYHTVQECASTSNRVCSDIIVRQLQRINARRLRESLNNSRQKPQAHTRRARRALALAQPHAMRENLGFRHKTVACATPPLYILYVG